MKNLKIFDQHAFAEFVRAREAADRDAAHLKPWKLSVYAPQMYYFENNGTFTTIFGREWGKHALYGMYKTRPMNPKKAADRRKYLPTMRLCPYLERKVWGREENEAQDVP